jgi:hypothetical protein
MSGCGEVSWISRNIRAAPNAPVNGDKPFIHYYAVAAVLQDDMDHGMRYD